MVTHEMVQAELQQRRHEADALRRAAEARASRQADPAGRRLRVPVPRLSLPAVGPVPRLARALRDA